MNISVRISRGGVTHMLKHNGMTLCGKHFHSGSKGEWDDKVTCKSCIKIEARTAEVELEAQLHPKPEVTTDDDSSAVSRIVKECVMVSMVDGGLLIPLKRA